MTLKTYPITPQHGENNGLTYWPRPYLDGAQRGGCRLHFAARRVRHRLHGVRVDVLDLHRQHVHVAGEGAHCVGVAEAANNL